jgi:putative ABC transport system ATP-binding protein
MVKLINATKFYNKKDKNVIALNDVTCEFEKGSFVSVVGRSGSGKSTLLNLIGGLDTISSGKIIFDGKPLNEMTKKELEIHRRFSIGMIFQSFNLIPYRSAIDNVILPMVFGNIPRNKRKQIAIAHLENVGLKDRMNHIPAEMSGGEAQRVAIARALANNPSLILADEPTGNLDSATSDEIINLLVDLNKNQNISIIMITHESDIAFRISDKIITLLDGKIINTLYPNQMRIAHETI